MRTKTAKPEILSDRNSTENEAAHRLAARFAQLDLDAETLELLLAALATDVCDHLAADIAEATAKS